MHILLQDGGQRQNNTPISKINTCLFFPVGKPNLSFCHFKTLLQFCQRGPLSKMQARSHSQQSHYWSDCDNDLKGRRCSLAKDETVAEATVIKTAAAVVTALQSSNMNKRPFSFSFTGPSFRKKNKEKSLPYDFFWLQL